MLASHAEGLTLAWLGTAREAQTGSLSWESAMITRAATQAIFLRITAPQIWRMATLAVLCLNFCWLGAVLSDCVDGLASWQ